jgi:hypothetical protein
VAEAGGREAAGVSHNLGRELSERRIFLFGFAVTPSKGPNRPKESKEMQAIFLGFPWISLQANSRLG